ncbi:class D sortase [Pseudomarimonas salicorniae]|uniref:Class D sortase n=1 Tax=Pseudomarimonas salicorniae TaxID=2933270 RepID=A0ABT0GFC6_9GAMM|nr:class D sortase [Lysobacter sp. CAU 1642]MCK7593057.1 class D sortase [Lysobacter sp. CAU 1642]
MSAAGRQAAARSRWLVGFETACWLIAMVGATLWLSVWLLGRAESDRGLSAFDAQVQSASSPAGVALSIRDAHILQIEGLAHSRRVPVAQSPAVRPDKGAWSEVRRADYLPTLPGDVSEAEEMPIAVLSIGGVGLRVPVFADTSERNLNRGAGLFHVSGGEGSPRNHIIAAHRDGWFRKLQHVDVGAQVLLEVPTGSQQRYRVISIDVVDPSDLSALEPTSREALTLVTCYPFYFVGPAPRRFIVRAVAE